MKKTLLLLSAITLVLLSVTAHAQFNASKVKYWVGSGPDSTILVVDFHDATWDTSYAWGYLHSSGATGQNLLTDIAAADTNFSVAIGGGFLNDISYGSHSGIGGTNGYYWSTLDGPSVSALAMNAGITATLTNGGVFGCSFTNFNPALSPGEPIAAFNPFLFTAHDATFWVGTGTDTTLLVIDFLTGTGITSYAWGYKHSSGATAQQMLQAIDTADANLHIAIAGGFLNDITYNTLSGIGGSPNYWGTWSATNLGNWDMNMGISTVLGHHDLFGCAYTDFAPALRPNYPTAAAAPTGITTVQPSATIRVYPNPTTEFVYIQLNQSLQQSAVIKITDVTGRVVYTNNSNAVSFQIPVAQLPNGIYNVSVSGNNFVANQSFIKQ